jgi:Type I phosphodiesterase / nucleotide pyrophosphatase
MLSMRGRLILCVAVLLVALGLGLAFGPWRPTFGPGAEPGPVKLVVMVIFDQLRGDYPERWGDLYGKGGLRRLMEDGTWFQNCHYPYSDTVTAPGHASLATGCSPWRHGIILNDWYERAEKTNVYCAAEMRYEQVPPRPPGPKKEDKGGGSPARLLAPTLADALRQNAGDRSRIVSLSLKDRGAILPGGAKPDACYWFDTTTGLFATSTYYRDRVHPWVEEFNRSRPADHWFGKEWTHLRPDLDYTPRSGPDDVAGEGVDSQKKRTFPHPLDGGLTEPGLKYYEALYASPFGNELLLDLTLKAIDAEKLGTHEKPDLLCVSFSSNDPVGHLWGPDSQEVMDVTLRTDLIVRGLLDHLDAHVGKGRYVLAVSADHGVCPLPEVSRAKGIDANRLSPVLAFTAAEAFLQEEFARGKDDVPNALELARTEQFYLNRAWLKAVDGSSSVVEKALADWLQKQPYIEKAYTRTQLLGELPTDDKLGQAVRRSFHPDRSGDVMPVLKPYYFMSTYLTGTTHGTPHPYDTHVPLFVFGANVKAQVRKERVTPQAMPVILAHAIGIDPPAKAEAELPAEVFTR